MINIEEKKKRTIIYNIVKKIKKKGIHSLVMRREVVPVTTYL